MYGDDTTPIKLDTKTRLYDPSELAEGDGWHKHELTFHVLTSPDMEKYRTVIPARDDESREGACKVYQTICPNAHTTEVDDPDDPPPEARWNEYLQEWTTLERVHHLDEISYDPNDPGSPQLVDLIRDVRLAESAHEDDPIPDEMKYLKRVDEHL
jgi:hypothetical protein